MKKIKSFFYVVLCMLLALCLPLSACNQSSTTDPNNPTGIVLLDFADETIEVGLGENYVLPNGVAFDEAGNDYRVEYEVKDSNGETVQILNGRFKVKEMGEAKYVITCYAEIASEQFITRKITLNVIDRTAPSITIAPTAFAFVGEAYTIKGVEVSDNTGETVEPTYKVTKKSDGSEMTVTNGTFTPDARGEYTLEVTATDTAGNKGVNTAPIYARAPMGEYVIENFNDEYGLPVFSVKEAAFTNDDVVYHETFDPTPDLPDSGDERTGVAQGNSVLADSGAYGPHYYFKFDSSFKDIGDFEYVYIKAYIKSEIASDRPQVELYTQNEPLGDNANGGYVNVNEWIEIRLTAEDICSPDSAFSDASAIREGETPIDCFKRKMTSGSGAYLFWLPTNREYESNGSTVKDSAYNYTLYVDEIGYKPMFNPTVDVQASYNLGETITLNPTVITDESVYQIETKVIDPSGNIVTLNDNQFRLIEAGEYKIQLTYVGAEYDGYTEYTVTVVSTKTIDIGAYSGSPAQGDTVTIPTATIDGGDVTASVSMNGYNIPMASANTFLASVAGDYVVTYASEIDGLIYKNTLTITVARGAVQVNEVISFASKAEMDNNTLTNSLTATWIPAFEGKDGVVKLSSDASWSYFAFKQLQAMSAYDGYEYLVIRMYVPASADVSGSFYLVGDSGACSFGATRDCWVEYTISGDIFRTAWSASDFNVYNKQINFRLNGDIYIDEIYMMNDISDTGLEAVVTNKTTAGATLRDGDKFSVALSSGAPSGANLVVKAPDGSIVADPADITAVFGEYTIEITCERYLGKITSTVEVASVFDFAFTTEASVSGATVTLKDYSVTANQTNVKDDASVVITVTLDGYTGDIQVDGLTFTAPFTGATYNVKYEVTYDNKTYEFTYTVTVDSTYTATGSEVLNFAEPAQLTNTQAYDSNISWLASYEGATGVAKMTATGGWGHFGFKPAQDMSAYANCDYLVVRMYIADGFTGTLWLGGASNCQTAIQTGKWVDYYFPGEKFTTNWANSATNYYVYNMALVASTACEIYIDEIYTISITPATGNQVLNFAESAQIGIYTAMENGASIEWVADYESATGVAKVSAQSGWGYFGFKPMQDMSVYENCNYLVVRMYIEDGFSGTFWINNVNTYCQTAVQTGAWVDYYFTGSAFTSNWADCATNYNVWSMSIAFSQAGTFYIDEIFVANELPA